MSALETGDADLIESWLTILHDRGMEAIPPEFQPSVIEQEVERLSDPYTGHRYFRQHYEYIRIKGRGEGKGWQRLCPNGIPRRDERTGRSWAWQLEMAEYRAHFDVFVTHKARQLGESFDLASLVLHSSMFYGDQAVVIIANKLPNSKRILRRAHAQYNRLPDWLKEYSPMTSRAMQLTTFANGSTIEPMSSKSDTGRSEAATLVVIDEVAFIDNLEDVWASVEAAADGGGRIIIVSTANGMGNMFHTWCVDGASGEYRFGVGKQPDGVPDIVVREAPSGMGWCFLPYWLDPSRDEAWLEKKRHTYRGSIAKLYQEFPRTWEEAFISSGQAFFHQESLNKHEQTAMDADFVRGRMAWVDEEAQIATFVPDERGFIALHVPLEMIETLKATGRPFVIGMDCAGDQPWGDYHAASAVQRGFGWDKGSRIPLGERIPHRQLITFHGYMDADGYAEQMVRLGYWLGTALLVPEANGVGQSVIHYLKRSKYPRVYKRQPAQEDQLQKVGLIIGWSTNSKTKPYMYGELERMQREDELEILDIETINEMRSVRYLGASRIGVEEPGHDDRPDGLAMACANLRHARPMRGVGMVREDGTMHPLLKQMLDAERNQGMPPLGSEMY